MTHLELLFAVEKHPRLYIGAERLDLLDAFLCVYAVSRLEENLDSSDKWIDILYYIEGCFGQLRTAKEGGEVASNPPINQMNKRGALSSERWSKLIRRHANSDREAFDTFFTLLHAYCKDQEEKARA